MIRDFTGEVRNTLLTRIRKISDYSGSFSTAGGFCSVQMINTHQEVVKEMADSAIAQVEGVFNSVYETESVYAARLEMFENELSGFKGTAAELTLNGIHGLAPGLMAALKSEFLNEADIKEKENRIAEFEKDNKELAKKVNKLLKKLDKEQIRDIKYILYSSDEHGRTLYLSELESYTIGNTKGNKTGFFTTKNNTINVDMTKEKDNPRGAYTTFFHESGHAIDYNHIDDGKFYSITYRNEDGESLQELIYKDVRNDVEKTVSLYTSDEEMQRNITDHIMDAGKGDVPELSKTEKKLLENVQMYYNKDLKGTSNEAGSDIYGGVTNNIIHGSYGHWSESYWYDKNGNATYAQSRELWAEYYSYSITKNEEAMENLKEHFPNAGEMLDEIAGDMAS